MSWASATKLRERAKRLQHFENKRAVVTKLSFVLMEQTSLTAVFQGAEGKKKSFFENSCIKVKITIALNWVFLFSEFLGVKLQPRLDLSMRGLATSSTRPLTGESPTPPDSQQTKGDPRNLLHVPGI